MSSFSVRRELNYNSPICSRNLCIKEYSNWPTIPQLYIGGEFVGGSDIIMEMYNSGELVKMLDIDTRK